MSLLEDTIQLLQARRSKNVTPESVRFSLTYLNLLAEGKPVSAQRLAEKLGDPIEFVTTAFAQMQQGGCEFNEDGELIGAVLTLTPTRHQFVVDGVILYSWCALDTMFLPSYIGKSAEVASTCPQTASGISLTITPSGVETFTPSEAVVSVMTAENCSAGIEGTFCSQVNFFSSRNAAAQWIGNRQDFVILTVQEAYQLVRKVYIQPMM